MAQPRPFKNLKMKELKAIIEAYRQVDFNVRKAALATVVRVRGSSYRSPGARMLITDDGRWVGSISGGCLEGDALRKARKVMSEKIPVTVTYDTREESNQNLGIGLGCNGVIDVLIEPVDHEATNNAISLFESFIKANNPVALATVFSGTSETGEKLIAQLDGSLSGTLADQPLGRLITPDLSKVFDHRRSEAVAYDVTGRSVEVFMELIQPSLSLLIFGGGFDARPVSQLAKSLGWDVQITDECVAHLAPAFFPEGSKLSLCHRDFVDREIQVTPYTACVLMSHNYEYDHDVLRKLLPTTTPFIGILGPRKRFDKMLSEFKLEGIALTQEDFHRIHSPIGLDIGAETPDEIAVSIIAEIQAKYAARSGGFLKYRSGPIHQRDQVSDQVFKHVYISPGAERIAGNQ